MRAAPAAPLREDPTCDPCLIAVHADYLDSRTQKLEHLGTFSCVEEAAARDPNLTSPLSRASPLCPHMRPCQAALAVARAARRAGELSQQVDQQAQLEPTFLI